MSPRMSEEQFEMRARIAKALGHAGRLMMLDVLSRDGPLSVSALAERLGVDQSTISRHLSLLRQVGIVDARRESGHQLYRMRVQCLDGFWQCVEGVIAHEAAAHDEIVSAERVALIHTETLAPIRRRKKR